MTQTTVDNVKALLGNFSDEFTDSEISAMIDLAYTYLSDMTQGTVDGDQEEMLHRWLTGHLLLKKRVYSGIGHDVGNISAGGFSYNLTHDPARAEQSNLFWKEFEKMLRIFLPSSVEVID